MEPERPRGEDEELTRRDKRKKVAKTAQPLVRAETSLEINPVFKVTGRNRDATPYVYERVVQAEDGLELRKIWKVVPSGEYGAPGGKDQDVFVAVLELLERRGGMPADGEIETSLNELLGILGKADSGKNYRELKESLLRVHHTGIESRDAFFSKETESYVTDGFEIWKVKIVESKRKADGRTVTRVKIKFHDLFIRSFMAHYLKGLDTEFYWTLHSYLSKRLYRLIDQMRGAEVAWDEDLFELQKQLPLTGYRYVSKIKQVLDPAHRELQETGFLADVWYDEDDHVYYRVSEAFARRRAAFELSGNPEEFIAIERLLSEGVRGDVARDLVAKHGAKRCLRYAEALPFQAGIRNRAGWLKKAIEEVYELPELRSLPGRREQPPSTTSQGRREGYGWFFDNSSAPTDGGSERADDESSSTEEGLPDTTAEVAWRSMVDRFLDTRDHPVDAAWFDHYSGYSLRNGVLVVRTPHRAAADAIIERFGEEFGALWRNLVGEDARIFVGSPDECAKAVTYLQRSGSKASSSEGGRRRRESYEWLFGE